LLGSNELDDQELTVLREQSYAFAHFALGLYPPAAAAPSTDPATGDAADFAAALTLIPQEHRDEVIERAAIMEYCGGLSRAIAEKAAVLERITVAQFAWQHQLPH